MRNCVVLILRDGTRYHLSGWASDVAQKIEKAVKDDVILLPLELDRIPTGQMTHINPREVSSVYDS